MATLRQIRQRIRIARNIQQITRAMKLIAAARLKRAQDRVLAARPYSEKMQTLIGTLALASGQIEHPLLQNREQVRRVGVLLVTADRGLCGSYNTNIIRRCLDFIQQYEPDQIRLLTVGKKGMQFMGRRGYPSVQHFSIPLSGPTIAHAQEIARTAQELFLSEEVDEFYLAYSRFRSALVQIPTVQRLLPVEPAEVEGDHHAHLEFIFEPSADELLRRLLPRYVFNLVFQALLEATASEHGARMTAMSAATDNAGKMISTLTLNLNRARQAAITKEILEVVSGAEALKEGE
ncbi:MAG: ATP synthase F1 subunit gamma [Armatimonadota bacterium]|nr:ATP synthase F1 subunit gamma [bacterium]MCS7310859.1 ATP synthase F1 subunit gamma [Armatimonadota bacterium]MDW8291126.1 ATP synthase F1 subunit gamma [Armatimonadota bacterium]